MTIVSYLRDDGSYISHEDLAERIIKYIRNLRLGFNNPNIPTFEQLEKWLRLDCRLAILPPIAVLDNYLGMTQKELAQWSYENDFINRKNTN